MSRGRKRHRKKRALTTKQQSRVRTLTTCFSFGFTNPLRPMRNRPQPSILTPEELAQLRAMYDEWLESDTGAFFDFPWLREVGRQELYRMASDSKRFEKCLDEIMATADIDLSVYRRKAERLGRDE